MEDEITLRELIEILLRQKRLILGITVTALVVSFVFSFFILTPEYKAAAQLKITAYQVDGNGKTLVLRTKTEEYMPLFIEEYFRVAAAGIEGEKFTPREIERAVTITEEDGGLLKVAAVWNNPEDAAAMANAVADNFPPYSQGREQKRLMDILRNWEERSQQYEEELDEVIGQLEELKGRDFWFGHLEQEAELLGGERAKLKMDIRLLKDEIGLLEERAPFTVRSSAVAPKNPVNPRRSLNLALATVLGLMVGTFVAFFKEYWESTRPEAESQTM